MKVLSFQRVVVFVTFVLLAGFSSVSAAVAEEGIVGDWVVKTDFNEWKMESILSLSKDKAGKLGGQWISFWGLNELQNVKYEAGKLSFSLVYRFGGNESTSKYSMTIKDGKLTGSGSSDRGEFTFEGKPLTPLPCVVGTWEFKSKWREREYVSTLTVKADKDGKLSGQWQNQRGQSEISDLKFAEGKLTFTRTSTYQDRKRESSYKLSVNGNTLSGTRKSQRGEREVVGKLVGAALVGKWELTISSERGDRKQILWVHPDMSGMYGPVLLEKVNLEGDKVSFKLVQSFGDRVFESEFKGQLKDEKLTGESTSSRGTRKVVGRKI